MNLPHGWLAPDWRVAGVGALMTTREGGQSVPPFDSMNLQPGGGDDAGAVARNRELLAEVSRAVPVFLRQVHGKRVVQLTAADARADAPVHEADAVITTEEGIACTIQVADCLPVLFAAPDGRAVGAAHAGWRGLAGGVLEAAVDALCGAAGCAPRDVRAWLGPCIGPGRFEVGADVIAAFARSPRPDEAPRFVPVKDGKWLANLPLLAADRLQAVGVTSISGSGACTVDDPSRFFSFRRDRVTGRMAALVWLERQA